MSLIGILFIVILVIAFIALILFIGKKCCDMAIKPSVTEQYANLIFTPEQKDILDKTHKEGLDWLKKNSKEIEIISYDGLKLKGYEIKAKEESDVWVIAVHGYLGKGADMAIFMEQFIKYGYNGLIVDLRAHSKSEGKYLGMGWIDHYDIQLWIEKLIEENMNCKIILFGVSMGAATVSMTTGEKIPKNVKCAIADCGYTTVWDEFKIHLKKIFHIPSFPILYVASIMSKIYAGYSFKQASTIKQVEKSKTPTLFIHGTKDKFVPFNMLEKIYSSANCEKEKLEIEEATHAESVNKNPEKYWETVKNFINKYI